jgi:DNA-binding MarR family transcriptional regulator
LGDEISEKLDGMSAEIRTFAKKLRVDTFWTLRSTSYLIERFLKMQSSKRHLSHSGVDLLCVLVLGGGQMTPTNISKQISRSKYGVTRIVDRLEKQGLVRRELQGDDRRLREVRITAKGLKVVEENYIEVHEHIKVLLDPLIDEKAKELNNMLKQLRQNLNVAISEYRTKKRNLIWLYTLINPICSNYELSS